MTNAAIRADVGILARISPISAWVSETSRWKTRGRRPRAPRSRGTPPARTVEHDGAIPHRRIAPTSSTRSAGRRRSHAGSPPPDAARGPAARRPSPDLGPPRAAGRSDCIGGARPKAPRDGQTPPVQARHPAHVTTSCRRRKSLYPRHPGARPPRRACARPHPAYPAPDFAMQHRRTSPHGHRAHLLHHQAGRHAAEPHRRHQRHLREERPAHRRPEAHLDVARARQEVLRGARRAPLLQRPGGLHGLRPGRGAGAGRRGRGGEEPRTDGRDQPGQRRRGHHPQAVRREHRGEFRARLRQRRRTPRSRSPTSSPATNWSADASR